MTIKQQIQAELNIRRDSLEFRAAIENICREYMDGLWEVAAESGHLSVLLEIIGERDKEFERMQRQQLKSGKPG